MRPYVKGRYVTMTSDGVLNYSTNNFKNSFTIPLYEREKETPKFHHRRKMHINDAVYIKELQQLAVSVDDRELLFYNCKYSPNLFKIKYGLFEDESRIITMDYWSDGKEARLFLGYSNGHVTVFISKDILKNGLFNETLFDSVLDYPTAYVSDLLQTQSQDFSSLRISVFLHDMCSQIRYFPSIQSFTVCPASCESMVLAKFSSDSVSKKPKLSTNVFKNNRSYKFFACAEFCPESAFLVTGGKDGLLRVWFPHQTSSCCRRLKGHEEAITHVLYNPVELILISISTDLNVRIWSETKWTCIQSFFVNNIKMAPISSLYYNIQNNELFMANSDIARFFGWGTKRFYKALTSHNMPVCSALYHSIYKQVISVSLDGVLTVWDIVTGKTVMEFRVSPENSVGHTAIAFNETQRQLITISHDGKMRFWNFVLGIELAVHPVKIPKEARSTVHLNNDHLFVSTKDSNIILMLDLSHFVKHDSLNNRIL
ncbi:WD repeat-containing protein on Y chromosome-like [Melanotaenia boesemani]|uniref:WD repeat-containing protein on Y chromosome-like n=1 Tax=Melanotaenia boesemani TaxID=1250792 RepID=UPI001C04B59B|nr:WD repeat-containing protein on Y chromosome-like [Melanotaenia boesemani]